MSPFALFDRAAQAVVNRTMFGLMRSTGWSRSLIRSRLTLWVALPVDGLGCACMRPLWFGLALMLSGVAAYRWSSARERARDEAAERRGLAQRLNAVRWWDLAVVLICALFATVGAGPWRFWAIRSAVLLFVEYAAATPPAPPAKRSLVLARSAS